MPKVSIIVPVYNVEQYLQDCIDSLVNQTLDDMELIFVNDASPDRSLEILYENQKKYPEKIVVIDSKVNMRQGGARNIGLQKATAEYVGFVDSDDFVAPGMYEKLYARAQETGADAVFMSAVNARMDTKYADTVKKNPEEVFPIRFRAQRCSRFAGHPLSKEEKSDFLTFSESPSVWSGIYRKSVILDNNIRFPEHLKFEDNYWCSVVRCYLSSIAIADGVGYYYRYNENSTVHKRNTMDFYDRTTVENMLVEEAKARDLWEDHYDAWEYLYANRYGINTFLIYISRYDKIPYGDIQKLQAEISDKFPNWKKNRYLTADRTPKQMIRRLAFSLNPRSPVGRLGMKAIAAYFNR